MQRPSRKTRRRLEKGKVGFDRLREHEGVASNVVSTPIPPSGRANFESARCSGQRADKALMPRYSAKKKRKREIKKGGKKKDDRCEGERERERRRKKEIEMV